MTRFTVNGHEVSVEALPMARPWTCSVKIFGSLDPRKAAVRESAVRTVLVDGIPVNKLPIPLAQADGAVITTVEGVAEDDRLTPSRPPSLSTAPRSAESVRRALL